MMTSKNHWETVYGNRSDPETSWFQEHATQSLQLIHTVQPPLSASIIDIGGGTSPLVHDLIEAGYTNLSLLDLSGKALTRAQSKLKDRDPGITWWEGDITEAALPPDGYDLWHDRAVFHFLTHPSDRRQYTDAASKAIKPGGHLIVATFADDGPTECSGLPTCRYSPAALEAEFADTFECLQCQKENHRTPNGVEQPFVYCLFRRKG
ncbi:MULTISPECIES: class I SAM-dependent methyltransferase [Halomonadaceae]|nr:MULTISPECIES: class I SAM-dependent methyltransferase [Halomonas]